MKIKAIFNDLLDLAYPRLCPVCEERAVSPVQPVCLACLAHLPRTNFHRWENNPVNGVFTGRLNLVGATAYLYFEKTGITQSLLHALKYQGNTAIGELLGRIASRDLCNSEFMRDIDYLIPVPLHPDKLKLRGYNQSLYIARGLGRETEKRVLPDALQRLRHTDSQTRKGRFERWLNVEKLFAVQQPEQLQDKHILLVDDVLTTGATLESCARGLLRVRGVRISVFTAAFAP